MYFVVAKMRRLISLSSWNSSSMEGIHVISMLSGPASAVGDDERSKTVAQIARKSQVYEFAIDVCFFLFLLCFLFSLLLLMEWMKLPKELTIATFLSVSSLLLWFCRVTAPLSATSLKDPCLQQWHSITLYLHYCHSHY